ncbi:MAG TPA: ABC transporter permease [Puia sp.]|nr:ABC transporter permease [Puia sp.]
MITNYLKTAWRSIRKQKGFFALNFLGLYVSVISCLLIGLVLLHETSFDRRPAKGVAVYRVIGAANNSNGGVEYGAVTPYPLATAMRAALPEQKRISQIHFDVDNLLVTVGTKKFSENKVVFADSVFPQIFPLDVKAGSLRRAFAEPGFAVLTQTLATKYFGHEPAVGQRIRYQNVLDLEVAAVVADPPANSHLPYTMLISYRSMSPLIIGGFPLDQWPLRAKGYTYIALPAGAGPVRQIQTTLDAIAKANLPKDEVARHSTFQLQRIEDIHTDQRTAGSNPSYTVNNSYLYLLAAIGLFLLLAACINYTNLSTALAIKKSKEVGVRKTMGATRPVLMGQFLTETFVLTAVVILAAAATVPLLIPPLNRFLERDIPTDWLNLDTTLLMLALWIAISLLSGIYPAFVLSGFNPIAALKSKISAPKTSVVLLRRGLVVFQFLTAQVLIIGAIVVAKQLAYMQSAPLGFEKGNVLNIDLPDNNREHSEALMTRLSSIPGIATASLSIGAPVSHNQAGTEFNLKEKYRTEKLNCAIKAVDKNYLSAYGLQLVAGRWYDDADDRKIAFSVPDSLKEYAFVINETAARTLGFANPRDVVGRYLTFGFNDISARVIGVIKDYHVASMHTSVPPVLMVNMPFLFYTAGIRFTGPYSVRSLAAVEAAFNSVYPNDLFTSAFMDETIANTYKEERHTQQLFDIFTSISIIINVLGLVGLLSFMVEQKTKEIGVRKVLGASIASLSFLLSKDFLRLIVIAFLIAAPVAWYLMNQWLQGFAYRTAISWWIFGATVSGAIAVTALAVGYQTIRAALANPVRSLRSE